MTNIEPLPLIAAILVLLLTMFIGLMSARRTKTLSDYWVAGRSVGVFTNASAISSNYLSAASFLGVGAFVWAHGFDGVWYATGFAAGYILLLLFIASPLRRFGRYTIPDFCHGRFQSVRLRRAGIFWTVGISALYIIAQMVGVGTLMEVITGIPWVWGVIILGGVITLYVAFGGMTGVTFTQMLQFWIMLTAIVLPLLVLMPRHSYPQLLQYAAQDAAAAGQSVTLQDPTLPPDPRAAFSDAESERFANLSEWLKPFKRWNLFGSVSLLVALVCGTAGLPHILARFYTNPNAAKARWSTVWVLIFIGVFYMMTPIWGAYARMVLGPDAVLVNDAGAPNPNSMMLVTGALAGQWAKALIAAGAIAALLSTVSGLLIALSSAFAHDFYGEILRPQASDRQKMLAAKFAVLGFGAAAIGVGLMFRDINIIWWRRMTEAGAFAGIMIGGAISMAIVIGTLAGWWGFEQPAIISVPAAFLAIWIVSKRTYKHQAEDTCKILDSAFHALHHPDYAKVLEKMEKQQQSD